jgi:CheY-like chemotaxis protein
MLSLDFVEVRARERFEGAALTQTEKIKLLRIMAADDYPMVRERLRSVNSPRSHADRRRVRNGRGAVDKYFAEKPDVALADLRMPVINRIETLVQCARTNSCRLLEFLTPVNTFRDSLDVIAVGRRLLKPQVLIYRLKIPQRALDWGERHLGYWVRKMAVYEVPSNDFLSNTSASQCCLPVLSGHLPLPT